MSGTVGFVGLGTIGEPMAANLLRKGFSLTICGHTNPAPLERLAAQGATVVANPKEVATATSIIVTCVPDAPQVDEVCLGANGLMQGAKPGTIVVDCSTIAPTASQRIAAALAEKGIHFLDAPISGGPPRAATGDLAIMVGGEAEVFARALPVLNAMGRSVTHVGPSGMGEVVKLANNLIVGNLMIVLSEAMTLAVKAGVDAATARSVIMNSSGANYLLETWAANTMLKDSYDPGFATTLMQKDLGAALDTARSLGVPMMLTGLAYQLYELAEGAGDGRSDYSAISKLYQDTANVTIATGKSRK
ncbi:MAG: NAD(P)-dependent oxidoreductase [Chloroflexaceae bacterium]|jgi:3-hydroxyisobutyrate dehydrogenase|nr:NAD(P)-dependent oxidoreductase [Chloroflexaceae bacterium]